MLRRWPTAGALLTIVGGLALGAGTAAAATLWEFKFNETGTAPANTGSGAPAPTLVTRKAFYGSSDDLHGTDGSGVSGQVGDRALDVSGISTNGGMYPGKTFPPQLNVANANCTAIQTLTTMTLSGWFSAQAPITRGTYKGDGRLITFSHYSGGNLGFSVEFSTTDIARNQLKVVLDATTLYFDITPVMDFGDTNRWYFWALTYDGSLGVSNARLYMGTRDSAVAQVGPAQTANVGAIDSTTTDFSLNGSNGSGTLKGLQDNVRVDNVVMSLAALEARRAADADIPVYENINTLPYGETFESYPDGYELTATNGWSAPYPAMAIVTNNPYTNSYAGTFPIPGPHLATLHIDGRVTNSFAAPSNTRVWVDTILEAKHWTNGPLPAATLLTEAQFALCITSNRRVAAWNCPAPPDPTGTWTELLDTDVAPDSYVRVTVEIDYARDTTNYFHYRVRVNDTLSTQPKMWYAAVNTNASTLSRITLEGRFHLDDLAVQTENPFALASIAASSLGYGSISPSGTIELPYGATAGFTNTPSPWYHLSAVTVDGVNTGAPAVYTFTNITNDHTIVARFAADTAASNTPTWWLAAAAPGWSNDWDAASTADQDGDGLLTWQEYIAGTDPTDPASALTLAIAASNGQWWITVPTIEPGLQYEGLSRYYSLESRPQLATGAWTAIPGFTDVRATGQILDCSQPMEATNQFYQGKVRLAP